MEKYRIIKTGLKTQKECDIIDGVLGQLSDGMWENSRAAEGYWPYIDAELEGGEVVLHVSKQYYSEGYLDNRFLKMSDDDVKKWLAKKIKQVIKEEGLDWKRDNSDETDYLDTSWRKSKQPSSVADCYYVYEVLKGRNVAKHPEYAKQMSISDALKTLDNAKIKYVQQEDEPWESDLDESAISWPLLSEAELTPEQKQRRRLRRQQRRDLKKAIAEQDRLGKERREFEEELRRNRQKEKHPYYVKIFQKSGNVGGGWWVEKPGKPEYQAYKDLETLKKYFGSDTEALINGARLDYEDGEAGGPGWKMRLCDLPEIPDEILEKLNRDLAKGVSMSHHTREW
jgi:hypothetical protein